MLFIIGVVLIVKGWLGRDSHSRAIVLTGRVVAMRREIEYQYTEREEYKGSSSAIRLVDDLFPRYRGAGEAVTVYKPIVRFFYNGDMHEVVVQESSEYKPVLNVSMQIAFFPEDPTIVWRPAKVGLLSDGLLFVGMILLLVGVLDYFGMLPLLPEGEQLPAAEDW